MKDSNRRMFLGSSGVIALGLLAGPQTTEAAELSEGEKANVAVVKAFVAAAATQRVDQMLKYMAEDAVYRQTETTPPAIGHEQIRIRLGPFLERAERVQWDIVDTYAKGPMVVNHRIDRFEGGARPLLWEGVGTFFLKDGLIQEWFDYTIRVAR